MSKGLRPYLVQLSNKTEVKIDSDEMDNVLSGIKAGAPIRVRQGIINPSFIVAIVPDMKRWEDALVIPSGVRSTEVFEKAKETRRVNGVKPLADLLAGHFDGKKPLPEGKPRLPYKDNEIWKRLQIF